MRVILVLSCPSIINDQPTGMVLGRLDKAVEVWNQLSHDDLMVIVSGGDGRGKRKLPSSLIMKRYLIEKGIPSHCITEDNQAFDTKDNVINCNQILKNIPVYNLYVVTSNFHISRVKLLFNVLTDLKIPISFFGTDKYHSDQDLIKYRINERLAITKIFASIKEKLSGEEGK